jgi:hypothetical protein
MKVIQLINEGERNKMIIILQKKKKTDLGMVTHACHSSYLGG